ALASRRRARGSGWWTRATACSRRLRCSSGRAASRLRSATMSSSNAKVGSRRVSAISVKDGSVARAGPALSLAFDVASEVVEDRLPALLLHFRRVHGLGVELDADAHACGLLAETHGRLAAVAEAIGDQFLRDDPGVGAAASEAHAAVLRFQAGAEGAALAQVHLAARRMPVVRGSVPANDVLGRVVRGPGLDRKSVVEGERGA